MDSIAQIYQQFLRLKLNNWMWKVFLAVSIANASFSGQLFAQCDSINFELKVLRDIASEVLGQHAYKVHEYTLELPQPIPDSMFIESFLGSFVSPTYIRLSFHPKYAQGCDSCRYVIFAHDSLRNIGAFVHRFFKRIIEEDSTLLNEPYPIVDFLEQKKLTCFFNVSEINQDTVNYTFQSRIKSMHWTNYGGNVLLSDFYFSRVYFNTDCSHAVLLVSAGITPDFYLVSKHHDGNWHIDKILNSGVIF